MDKGVVDTVKNHKRQHDDDDDDDDDDDENPSAGPNQGKKTKRRRNKELESSKKPSTTKETPKGKALLKGSKTGKSASAKEPIKEPIDKVEMDDAVNTTSEYVVRDDDQQQDTSIPKTYKSLNQDWFKQPPRPLTPDPEWNKCQDYVLNRLKIENLTQDLLLGHAYNLLKDTYTSSIKVEYNFQECFDALIDKLDWNNPEGDRHPFDLSKPLLLQGRPSHLTVAANYFFNNDLEFLKTSNPEKTYKKTKVARVKKLHGYGHLEEVVVKRADQQLYKFKEGDFMDLHLNNIEEMLVLAV
uniref:Uncharacterized protein n=1 Tax=Tanacetum cinerariifolium TaxID=118510 RepID=A0A6L2N1B4_TANCI|nr:hypothetical protein [Tanacetum cinerariifolium]